MQLFGISSLVVLAFQGSVQALQTAITCTTTADCAWGETCVAGDSDTSVQACVPPSVCGGSSMGNCPSDDSGKLACLWRPYNDCSEGCAILNGNKGIYKCVSLTRCDAYYGGVSCSGKSQVENLLYVVMNRLTDCRGVLCRWMQCERSAMQWPGLVQYDVVER